MSGQSKPAAGVLWGLGVGPGDPDLITLKALKVLGTADVVAYPAPLERPPGERPPGERPGGESLARAIAAPHVPDGVLELPLRTAMVPGPGPADAAYDRHAAELAGHLEAGRTVAVLCVGDPFFYGSFMYLFERLADRHDVRVVPGVSALGACAAAARLPLTSRNQVMVVVPGPMDETAMEQRLRGADCAVVMKVGRHLAKVRRVLERLGLADRARYVERAGHPGERVVPVAELAEGDAVYFSMILAVRS